MRSEGDPYATVIKEDCLGEVGKKLRFVSTAHMHHCAPRAVPMKVHRAHGAVAEDVDQPAHNLQRRFVLHLPEKEPMRSVRAVRDAGQCPGIRKWKVAADC